MTASLVAETPQVLTCEKDQDYICGVGKRIRWSLLVVFVNQSSPIEYTSEIFVCDAG
jgi:hypothetical protein